MPRVSLHGCWAKIERAREHTHALVEIAEAFIERRPNQVRLEKEGDPTWVVMRVIVEPVPERIALVAGDVVHNLRSALDHLAWQLVISEGAQPGRHTAFPIYWCKGNFDKRVRNPSEGRLSPLHGIDPSGDKWALVESAQPYNAPERAVAGLEALARLSNADKHRTLLAGISLVGDFDAMELAKFVDGLEVADYKTALSGPAVLTHDAEVGRFLPQTTGAMQMKRDLPFEVALSDTDDPDEGIAVSVALFDRMRAEVVRVVRAFEPFLA